MRAVLRLSEKNKSIKNAIINSLREFSKFFGLKKFTMSSRAAVLRTALRFFRYNSIA